MPNGKVNIAYIDGANLHKGMGDLGWKLDYLKFRIWLKEKYNVELAYIFLGKVPEYWHTYDNLTSAGFVLIFKEIMRNTDGKIKGNCDTNLVAKALQDFYLGRLDKAIIVSSDGDFEPLITLLKEGNAITSILSPRNRSSFLLRASKVPIITMNDLRKRLEK